MSEQRAIAALDTCGLAYRVIRHGPVRSLAEAAVARGVEPADVVKTLVVRRGEADFVFVLVPGDRTISWPKLRARNHHSVRIAAHLAGDRRPAAGRA